MKLFRTTKKHIKYWTNRKIDWEAHYMNPDHPHRMLLVEMLKRLPWMSLIEIGVGAGANLVAILKNIPGRQVGGVDVNPDAIDYCNKIFKGGIFKVDSADDIMLSDKSTDVILSDMCLIYVEPKKIKKYLRELKRVARNYVVLFEFHSPKWYERLAMKWKEGYNMYNWHKLLDKNGFYDVGIYKISPEFWPESDLQQKYGHIIVAKVPKYYD